MVPYEGYVRQMLPTDLQCYAILILSVVNECVGWLEPEEKKTAIVCALAIFQKSHENYERRCDLYTEGQFRKYAKLRIRGALLDQYADRIEARQQDFADKRREQEERLQIDQEVAASARRRAQGRPKHAEQLNEHFQNRLLADTPPSLTTLLRNVPYEDRPDVIFHLDDPWRANPEYDDYHVELTDDDGESGSTGRGAGSSRHILKLYRLLPAREASVLILRSRGYTLDQIGREMSFNRSRAQQLCEQAEKRFRQVLAKLQLGEDPLVLLAEADKLTQTSEKKSRKIHARSALPYTNDDFGGDYIIDEPERDSKLVEPIVDYQKLRREWLSSKVFQSRYAPFP